MPRCTRCNKNHDGSLVFCTKCALYYRNYRVKKLKDKNLCSGCFNIRDNFKYKTCTSCRKRSKMYRIKRLSNANNKICTKCFKEHNNKTKICITCLEKIRNYVEEIRLAKCLISLNNN